MDVLKPILAASIGLFSVTASASNFSYTFLQGNLGTVEFDDSIVIANDKYDGLGTFGAVGSYQSEEGVTLEAGFTRGFNDGDNSEINATEAFIAGGFPIALNNSIDLYPQVGLVRSEAEVCINSTCADESDSGGVAAIGARAWVTSRVEAGASLAQTTLDDADPVTRFVIGWWLSPEEARLSLAAAAQEDQTSFTGGFRLQF
ncbi:outer membrane protein with beta-barrel domain [Halospina denitrificans]|uniref:Outer membrane protein with beta-barrel domain n=1 Tax=Halospina denitrificans TaxID=332522 RepID=A0A4V3EQS5_9GAMM|nr:outer membrane beta-barrel protein [Halospina denitrificans]TDT43158.1 outer membrane protein with beta-barrel domain [Halospina denitrificans]